MRRVRLTRIPLLTERKDATKRSQVFSTCLQKFTTMGAGCTTCTIFDDIDGRDRRNNTESRNRLIRLPDPTSSAPQSVVGDDSDDSKHQMEYGGYIDPSPVQKKSLSERRAMFEQNFNTKSNKTSKSHDEETKTNHKSTLAERRAMFESKNKSTKNTKTRAKSTPNTNTNKAKKKWTVKGIDDKSTNKKKVVHVTSSTQSKAEDEEPSVSMSHKDRMAMYEKDIADTAEKEKQRIQKHKDERGGYAGVEVCYIHSINEHMRMMFVCIQVSAEQKERARKLLEERVEKQKKGGNTAGDDVGGIVLSGDVTNDIVLNGDDGQAATKKPKKRTMNELLRDATESDGTAIVSGMNLIQSEYDHKEKKDLSVLNMNNNNMMTKLTDEQKLKFINSVAHSVVDSKSDTMERVTMCNTGIEDKMMIEFMKVLVENKDKVRMNELWLESNRIGDDGMKALCELIECNLECLRVIKLYNNKRDVSTAVCNQMIDSLDKNDKITKFTFEFRLRHQKDKLEKILRRNQELWRKSRLKKK